MTEKILLGHPHDIEIKCENDIIQICHCRAQTLLSLQSISNLSLPCFDTRRLRSKLGQQSHFKKKAITNQPFLSPVISSDERLPDFFFCEERIFFRVAVGVSVDFAASVVPKLVKVDVRDVDFFAFAGFNNKRVAGE